MGKPLRKKALLACLVCFLESHLLMLLLPCSGLSFQLVPLPRKPCVQDILKDYREHYLASKKDGKA